MVPMLPITISSRPARYRRYHLSAAPHRAVLHTVDSPSRSMYAASHAPADVVNRRPSHHAAVGARIVGPEYPMGSRLLCWRVTAAAIATAGRMKVSFGAG